MEKVPTFLLKKRVKRNSEYAQVALYSVAALPIVFSFYELTVMMLRLSLFV